MASVVKRHSGGQCVPPFRLGATRDWLQLLPEAGISQSMDRCTVVMPRPGDGWYAPPQSGGGFPWGELTDNGAQEMRTRGRELFAAKGLPRLRLCEQAQVLAVNSPRCIGSAQALVLGAQDAELDFAGAGPRPVEVLLSRSEELLPQVAPGSEAYPALGRASATELCSMEEVMQQQLGDIIAAIEARGYSWGELPHDLGTLCEGLRCLEARGVELDAAAAAKATVAHRLNFLRWSAPLHAGGASEAAAVVGPLLSSLLRTFDATGAGSAAATEESPSMALYVTEPSALAALLGALGLAGKGGASANTWPSFGSSLEMALLRGDDGLFVRFVHNGEPVMTGLGRDYVPYDILRARFELDSNA